MPFPVVIIIGRCLFCIIKWTYKVDIFPQWLLPQGIFSVHVLLPLNTKATKTCKSHFYSCCLYANQGKKRQTEQNKQTLFSPDGCKVSHVHSSHYRRTGKFCLWHSWQFQALIDLLRHRRPVLFTLNLCNMERKRRYKSKGSTFSSHIYNHYYCSWEDLSCNLGHKATNYTHLYGSPFWKSRAPWSQHPCPKAPAWLPPSSPGSSAIQFYSGGCGCFHLMQIGVGCG